MEAQQKISAARLQAKVGRTLEVLVDAIDEQGATGRSWADAPEIDGQVFFNGDDCAPGDRVRVKIEEADEYDLYGFRQR